MSKSLWPHELQHAITISQSLLKFMSVKSVLSNHLILCHPLLLLLSIFPSIRVFSNELVLIIRCSKYWSFTFNIIPSNEYSGLISLRLTGLISLLSKGLSGAFSSPRVWRHQFFGVLPSLLSSSHNHMWSCEDHSLHYMNLCRQSDVSAFQHCLGLSSLTCQEAIIFWFHVCSHNLQWFWSPRRGNLSLLPPFPFLFAMQ